MLSKLAIKNYALIDDLEVSFSSGLTTITGETGAGKSILLGALGLVLGNRADTTVLRDPGKKCVVEAEFHIAAYNLEPLFRRLNQDYDPLTIIRREISSGGRSRAFINDTPVTLDIMNEIGRHFIDIHSQHHTLKLTDTDFQMKVVDALAGNAILLAAYRKKLTEYKATRRELDEFLSGQQAAEKEFDYNTFLLKELEEADLKEGMQEELELEQEELSNVQEIIETLSQGEQVLQDESAGVLAVLGQLTNIAGKLAGFGRKYEELHQRIQSAYIELQDVSSDWADLGERVEINPERLALVNQRLETLYALQKKHGVSEISELLQVQGKLAERVSDTANMEGKIASHRLLLEEIEQELRTYSDKLNEKRTAVLAELEDDLVANLQLLGIPNADVKIRLEREPDFGSQGSDHIQFMFRANKGTEFGPLKKVASGGELSRIMLTIKSILVRYETLPTLIFDEIDTGVSGEISNQMGEMMRSMSKGMQLLSITHLPQVASKGDHHLKVYKEDSEGLTRTRITKLGPDERILEIAEMLDGKALSESALAHARQLLN